MGWDRGRYYTRTRRIGGRIVREYVGTGPVAALAAELDRLDREARKHRAGDLRRAVADLDDLAALIDPVDTLAVVVGKALLLAAGYRQHHRSEWRAHRGEA